MLFRRTVSMLLLAAYLPACTAYRLTDEPLAQLTASPKPVGRVCVTKLNGIQVEVWEPRVAGDTLFGSNAAPGKATAGVAIALADIQSTEVRKFDTGRTVVAVVVIGGVLTLAGLVMKSVMDDTMKWSSLGY